MSETSKKQDNLFFDAGELIIENNNASPEYLQGILNVDNNRAISILNELESEGVISTDSEGNRIVSMSLDEYKMIFANHFNSTNLTNNPTDTKHIDNKPVSQNNEKKRDWLSTLIKFLILLLLILLLYKLSRLFIVVNTTTHTTETQKEVVKGWVQSGPRWKYYDTSGNEVRNGWVEYDGRLYFLDDWGYLATDKWVDYLGKRFYVDGEGKMLVSQWVNDTYYVGADGAMLKDTITPDGYRVDASGKYIKPTVAATTIPPTTKIVVPETQIQQTQIQQTINGDYNKSKVIEILPEGYTQFNPETISPEIVSPTGSYNATYNNNIIETEAPNYRLQSINSYSKSMYLDNGKQCRITLALPIFTDINGNGITNLNYLTELEKDAIVEELAQIVEESSEEQEGEYRTVYKYISSIKMTDGRISSQDGYELVYKMTGRKSWNDGDSEKINIIMTYDKQNLSMDYYIE